MSDAILITIFVFVLLLLITIEATIDLGEAKAIFSRDPFNQNTPSQSNNNIPSFKAKQTAELSAHINCFNSSDCSHSQHLEQRIQQFDIPKQSNAVS